MISKGKQFTDTHSGPVQQKKRHSCFRLITYCLQKSIELFLHPEVLRFSFTLADRSCLPAGIILQVIIPHGIIENCSQLAVHCFQISRRISFSILILIRQQLILPCTDICHRNFTENLLFKIRLDFQVNNISLRVHSVFSETDIHIFVINLQKISKFNIHTLALLLQEISFPFLSFTLGPESSFLFSFPISLPVFVIDLYFPVFSFFVNPHY